MQSFQPFCFDLRAIVLVMTLPTIPSNSLQTILGAGGTIGRELCKHLPQYTSRVRQVGRNPKAQNPGDEWVVASLLDADQTDRAVAGSQIVYLLVGLEYKTSVWREQWPIVMNNTIRACQKHGARLVFFDNVYSYGLVQGKMTESTPFNPCSKKGEVRAKIATQLLEETKKGNIQSMIVRAADFYGPQAALSMTHATVTQNLWKGKAPQWIGDPKKIHTFTYAPDAGKCVARLGNSEASYGQTWHALTSPQAITGEHYVRLACQAAGRPYKIQALPRLGVKALGLFIPVLREFGEMMYQFDRDYIFDSSKYAAAFSDQATDYATGITACGAARD